MRPIAVLVSHSFLGRFTWFWARSKAAKQGFQMIPYSRGKWQNFSVPNFAPYYFNCSLNCTLFRQYCLDFDESRLVRKVISRHMLGIYKILLLLPDNHLSMNCTKEAIIPFWHMHIKCAVHFYSINVIALSTASIITWIEVNRSKADRGRAVQSSDVNHTARIWEHWNFVIYLTSMVSFESPA